MPELAQQARRAPRAGGVAVHGLGEPPTAFAAEFLQQRRVEVGHAVAPAGGGLGAAGVQPRRGSSAPACRPVPGAPRRGSGTLHAGLDRAQAVVASWVCGSKAWRTMGAVLAPRRRGARALELGGVERMLEGVGDGVHGGFAEAALSAQRRSGHARRHLAVDAGGQLVHKSARPARRSSSRGRLRSPARSTARPRCRSCCGRRAAARRPRAAQATAARR